MGARPSSFKKGGGFLNGVDGTITGYEFTDDMITKDGRQPFKPGKVKDAQGRTKDRFHSLNCILSVRVDGAEEDVTTTLFVGGAEDFTVEEDGHLLVPNEEGRELGASAGFSKFITSLCEAGFPESRLSETEIRFEPIIGTRCRFEQRKDEEATKKYGKRVDKKTKREYDRQDLVVSQVYDLPEASGKANGKTKAGKPAAKPGKDEGDVDVEELATETLLGILAEQDGNKIQQSKLGMKVLVALKTHPNREDVRKLLGSSDFLEQEYGWSYNKAKGIVEAA